MAGTVILGVRFMLHGVIQCNGVLGAAKGGAGDATKEAVHVFIHLPHLGNIFSLSVLRFLII